MARGVPELCLLCGEVHRGDCAGVTPSKKKAPVPRQRRPEPKMEAPRTEAGEVKTEPVKPRPSALDAMRRAAREAKSQAPKYVRPKRESKPAIVATEPEIGEDEAAFISAIRALTPLLDPNDPQLDPYRKYLERPPTVQERSAAWRARRRADQTD